MIVMKVNGQEQRLEVDPFTPLLWVIREQLALTGTKFGCGTAQIESGIVYGLTAAMYGEITIEDGAVKQSNFHDYQALRMPDAPLIETHIINSHATVGGAGEPGTPGIAPALVNAVFDATGVRVRRLPLNRSEVKAQIEDSPGANA